jgi:hypothetical protein
MISGKSSVIGPDDMSTTLQLAWTAAIAPKFGRSDAWQKSRAQTRAICLTIDPPYRIGYHVVS